jgi:plastocyanin
VLLVVLMVASCGGSESTGPVATNAVDIRDNSFNPSAISVAPQTTVTWTWRGSDTHNVTFDDGQGSSGTQVSGTHTRTFAAAGTFGYRCTVHIGMAGSVVVR